MSWIEIEGETYEVHDMGGARDVWLKRLKRIEPTPMQPNGGWQAAATLPTSPDGFLVLRPPVTTLLLKDPNPTEARVINEWFERVAACGHFMPRAEVNEHVARAAAGERERHGAK